MSRRPPGPDRAEQNRATLKQLVKLESNKSCADCKRNKHPRWASWNLGIFICIRCSGIHRGMGTHISRVKSVDLDSWTEEQMASMLRWGNARANTYWEHKLAEGHVPNEAKIENFIRTKYDSKRWAMDGPIPDPSTLDYGEPDDDVPLNVVQEKVKERERSASLRSAQAAARVVQPTRAKQPEIDLFGDVSEPGPQPARPSTTEPAISRPPPPAVSAAQPKQMKPGESLLGLDFLNGAHTAPPARPLSTGPNAGRTSARTDLKQSILSLYATKPATPPLAQSASSSSSGIQPHPMTSPTLAQSNAQALGALGDAFGSLSFATQQSKAKPAPFSNFSPPPDHTQRMSTQKTLSLSGGSFFDVKSASPPKPGSHAQPAQPAQPAVTTRQPRNSFGADFGDFSSALPVKPTKIPSTANSAMSDLFTTSPASGPGPSPAPVSNPPPINFSAFNLPKPTPTSATIPAPRLAQSPNISTFAGANVWDSNDAWATPDPTPAAAPQPAPAQVAVSPPSHESRKAPAATRDQTPFESGWGDVESAKPANTTHSAADPPTQQDEEFGGWSHASPVATTPGPKQGAVSGNTDDLFGNVWG